MVTILGIIAVIVIPRLAHNSATTKENACQRNKAEINRVIERYYFLNDSWPSNLSDLTAGTDFPDGIPNCPVTGAAYTLDGVTHRISGHTPGNH